MPACAYELVNDDSPSAAQRYYGISVPGQEISWSLETQGALFQVRMHKNYVKSKPPKTRGQVKGFSRAARLRLLKTIARMRWTEIGPSMFITLTYPEAFLDRAMKLRTQDRSQFLRLVEKHLGRYVASIWRVEWKARKSGSNKGKLAAHVHLLLLGVPYLYWETVREWWKRILGHTGYIHTWVESTDGGEGAAKYVAKYCAKAESSSSLVSAANLNMVGRHWGLTRQSLIPLHEKRLKYGLSDAEVQCLRSVASELLESYDPRYDTSFTVLGRGAEQFAELWWENGLDTDIATWYAEKIRGGKGVD